MRQWNLIVDCEVLVVDEPYKLSYTWVGGPINTIVTWTLKKRMEQPTYILNKQDSKKKNQAFNGAKYGWAIRLKNLKRVRRIKNQPVI